MIKNKLIKPFITEKTTKNLEKRNKYCFLVDLKLNKIEIKKEVEKNYQVVVKTVNTLVCRPEYKSRHIKNKGLTKFKTNKVKKAIVELKEGDSIDIYNTN